MPELPDPPYEGKPRSVEAAAKALVPRKPKIGDSMPAPVPPQAPEPESPTADADGGGERRRRRRGSRGRSASSGSAGTAGAGRGRGGNQAKPIEQVINDDPIELDEKTLKRRRGRERKGRPVGRYLMAVHVGPKATQIAVLEGRNLVEHYVARPSDDVAQIHGNIYLGRVQNVLPGMEAAFVDIGTPKNAVLYRGDVQFDKEDVEERSQPRIEQVLRARQSIVCQVTKNPIAHKGARLTQEVSLPGRFVVLIPNSSTYGISKRLPDQERKRLRSLLDRVKPAQHGIIVRTAAEGVTEEEIERDVRRLVAQWDATDRLAKRATAPSLLYREPDLAVRVIREEFNTEYRSIVIDDVSLFEEVRDYVRSISPELADRVEYYDPSAEPLPLFERHHVHEQLVRATDRKVWLPSGGSLIIEHTEALTVIDVNTGKNVGSRSLEETVFHNNLEAAEEIARQLRLRDIGGIIVIDFVDMESKENREKTIQLFREALARDKTRTQVFDISELGLVEMTRKRIGEGLLESVSLPCEVCERRGVVLDPDLVGEHMQ
ncbi:MAG: ribonuclease [Acidimicrobiia bacterium]|nr:ribonuclease [Acidimicrobiia bacterium]